MIGMKSTKRILLKSNKMSFLISSFRATDGAVIVVHRAFDASGKPEQTPSSVQF